MDNRPIGVFDSGSGGLTVVAEIRKLLPNENIIYFGDLARVPYGTKSTELILSFSKQIVEFLMSFDVKAIVIACNTVSSTVYDDIKKFSHIPLIEVVTPGALAGINSTKNNKIGIIGTPATIKSNAYKKLIDKLSNNTIKVYSKACPLFVPLVEEGFTNNQIAKLCAYEYLNEHIKLDIDTLVLGCTHYPLLIDTIKNVVGESITVVNPAIKTAELLKDYLKENNLFSTSKSNDTFFTSDSVEKFDDTIQSILNTYEKSKLIQL